MHRSPYFGQSIEFLQHREYSHGDDLRHVDWKVWAKQDRMYVKQYEEETNLRASLLVDVSHSMQYGRGPLNKYEYACTAAVSLAYLLLRQQDAVGCLAFDEGVRAIVPMRSKRNHLNSIVQSLAVSAPQKKTELAQILRIAAESFPQRGLMILISDLLAPRPGFIKGIKLLRQRGHDVMVLHVMDDDELDFPFSGPTRFEGLELPEHLTCNPRALREGYLQALGAYLEEIRRACMQNACDYKLVRTSDPLDAVLAQFISNRMEAQRRT